MEELSAGQLAEPRAEPGEALVEVSWCGICGSDLDAFRRGRGISPGQVLGHELSGRVLEAPGVDGIEAGDRVAVRPVLPCGSCARCFAGESNLCERQTMIGFDIPGGMAARLLVPRAVAGVTVLPLPPEVDLRTAALIEPLAVGMRAARLLEADPADAALVVGAGPIGLATARFLAAAGCRPLVVSDPSQLRRRQALALGATAAVDPTSPHSSQQLAAGLGSRPGFDLAADCAGVEASLGAALRSLRRGGRLVLAALYGERLPVSLDRVVSGEISLRGSFAYRDEPQRVVELLRAGAIETAGMITHEFPLERAQEAFEAQLRPEQSIKVMLRVGGEAG